MALWRRAGNIHWGDPTTADRRIAFCAHRIATTLIFYCESVVYLIVPQFGSDQWKNICSILWEKTDDHPLC
jgi:hypothetical protein